MPTRLAVLLFSLALSGIPACTTSTPPNLAVGTWTGTLTPMNHPDMANPITYTVRYPNDALAIDLIGPGGNRLFTRSIHHTADSLHFTVDEPEEGVTLHCALGRQPDEGFAGRCADATGKWARFTMTPPAD